MLFAAITFCIVLFSCVASAEPEKPETIIGHMESAYDDFWPGFDVQVMPVMMFDGENTHLFRYPEKPEGFESSELDPNVFVFAGRYPEINACTSISFGETRVATYMFPGESDSTTVENAAAVVAHELFHVFQDQHFPAVHANEASLFGYPYRDEGVARIRIIEDALIRRIVKEQNQDSKVGLIKRFLALRFERFTRMDEEYSLYERRVELIEGTAQYIQNSMERIDPGTFAVGIPVQMDKVRNRCYYTGYFLCLWLDEYAPGWKPVVSNRSNPSLDLLLLDALLRSPIPAAEIEDSLREHARLEAAKQIDQYTHFLAELKHDFLSRPGWTIEITVDPGANMLSLRGFDPVNVSSLGGGEVLHQRMLRLACRESGNFEMIGSQCVTFGPKKHPVFHGMTRVILTGYPNLDAFSFENGTSSYHSDELAFSFTHTRLERDDSNMKLIVHISAAEQAVD